MAQDHVPKRFARSLLHHGLGYGLYDPASTRLIYPGTCGYLNDEGAWNPICDFNDEDSLKQLNLTAGPELSKAPDSEREWGPKISSSVKVRQLSFKANTSLLPAGIPASVGALFEFESSTEEAAILLTQSPVVKRSIYHEAPIRRWVQSNARTLAMSFPDAVRHDLIVVTSTHATRAASSNCVAAKGQNFTVGFDAGFVPLGEVAPSTSWYTSSKDTGWNHMSARSAQESLVVFFSGIRFRWRFGTFLKKHVSEVEKNHWFRSTIPATEDESTILVEKSSPEEEDLLLEVEFLGSSEHRLEQREVEEGNLDEVDEF